jgi:subtilisin family serine protease
MGSPTAPPFEATASAGAVITNGQSGVASLNVTADVAAILAGSQTHYGWALKKAAEDSAGQVRFGSRESGTAPRLVLAVAQDTSRPAVPEYGETPDDSLFVVQDPGDTIPIYYRRIFVVLFSDSASGTVVRSFLAKYQAAIVNGLPFVGAYIIQSSDPGSSWTDFQARLVAMRAEPGVSIVTSATRRAPPEGIRGRYPSDGLRRGRNSWFPGADTAWTQAQRVVRAHLAWGCETGDYGGSAPRVGILEWAYDTSFADLPAQRSLFRLSKDLDTSVSQSADHGTLVASVLAGVGDNDSGVAGMIWRSDLKLYAMTGPGNRRTRDPSFSFFGEILPQVVADQPKVLNISITFGTSGDLSQRSLLELALTKLLVNSPGTLIVLGIGNDDQALTPQEYLYQAGSTLFGLEQAMVSLRQQGLFTDRFLFVAGTQRHNTRWSRGPGSGSTEIIGMTDIAAPAESVAAMGQGGTVRLTGGTSVAAPMVAGTAALLLATEPTLQPGNLKDYVMRGAELARLNPGTGADSLPQPAAGFTGPVFQLDAYGSLVLVARERLLTPICGYPVRISDDFTSVVLESGGLSARSFAVPEVGNLQTLSVAQGGRLISVFGGDAVSAKSIVVDHRAQPVSTILPDMVRFFLERDTVDAQGVPGSFGLFTFKRSDGSTQTIDLLASARAQSQSTVLNTTVEISAAGIGRPRRLCRRRLGCAPASGAGSASP